MSRWGGFGLIFAGWLLLTGLIPSAAGPADVVREALGGQPRPPGAPIGAPPGAAGGRPPALPLLPSSPRQSPLGEVAPTIPSPVPAPAPAPPPPAVDAIPEPVDAPGTAPAEAPAETAQLPGTDGIAIPRIGVDARVVDVGLLASGEMETTANGAGRLAFSAQAGEAGNAVIAGHNDIDGEVFRRLPELRQGDEIFLRRGDSTYRYVVVVRTIVREQGATAQQRYENARWMDPTDGPTATLISCYPYRVDTHRVIVHAVMVAG